MRVPHTVRAKIFRDFAEQEIGASAETRAGHTARRAHTDCRALRDETLFEEREQPEEDRGGIASRIRDEVRATNRVAPRLGEPVRHGAAVVPVVPNSQIRGEIDGLGARVTRAFYP